MSVVTKNYKVEYIINATTLIDITDKVVSLDDFVLQSTGKISTAKFTLNAEFGNFITNDNSGTTPIFSQFDRIRITIIGDDGTTEQRKIFEVTTDLSQLAFQSSYFLPIELEGRERNLAGIPFGGFFRSGTHLDIAQQIAFSYNDQKGTLQPVLLGNIIDIPDFNPNIWDFTQVDNCYDALLAVIDHLNLPVSAGGAGNRFALIFNDLDPISTELDKLAFQILIQGTQNVTIPTLEQNDAHPITKIDKIKNVPTGSITIARGRPKTGTQPTNPSLFFSLLEFYRDIRPYSNILVYPEGSNVVLGANVTFGYPQRYVANQDVPAGNVPTPVSTFWDEIDVGDFVDAGSLTTPPLQYSPFTVDKVTPILNGFANPTGGFDPNTLGSTAIPDHNLVINDVRGTGDDKVGTFRNFVTFRSNSPNQADLTTDQKSYMFDIFNNGTSFGFYDGFTILVDPNIGTLQPPFDGSDSNGIPFENSMAIFKAFPNSPIAGAADGAGGEWFVFREVQEFDQCAVYAESIVYEFNVNFTAAGRVYPANDRRRGGGIGTFEWRSIADAFMGNECFHMPLSVTQVEGLVGDTLSTNEPLNDSFGDPYNENSGIKVEFGFNQADETQTERDVWFKILKRVVTQNVLGEFLLDLAVSTFNIFTTPNYTTVGWWYAWRSPYPFSTFGGIIERVGELYGGDVNSLNDHRYFDLFNIQYTTTGDRGWTHIDSPDLSEVTGVEFLFNFDITVDGTRVPWTGDLPFSYWCIDSEGTLWKSQKVMYRHLGETQQIKIEFGDLSPVFRGRTPLGVDNILENIIVGELEVNEVFFKDRVVIQGFQWEAPYDEFGRYSPDLIEQVLKAVFFDAFQGGSGDVRFTGIVDAYAFTKTPIAISKPTTLSSERTIIPNFEDFQNITNVVQLQRFADSQNQIEEFPYEQFTIVQGGINDLELEDSVFLHDEFLIDEEDDPGNPNTRLLTLREIHYSVPKDQGLIRKGVFVKVIDT